MTSDETAPMTPEQIQQAMKDLGPTPEKGLTLEQMGRLLGYTGGSVRQHMHRLANGQRTLGKAQQRLIEAYLDGYRPKDWPTT